jgi:predicted Rossmann fold flavoprotein
VVTARYDTIILGAGAAGLMCALTAGRRGRRVLVLERGPQVGAKILISGGGRCNFTNTDTAPGRFFSANPHFCKSALARYTPVDFLALVEKHRIAWHEKTLGQLFCNGSAKQVVAMLLDECAAAGVEIRVGAKVQNVTRSDTFRVETDQGDIAAETVVLATGGLSIPKMGATGLSHDIALRFDLKLTDIRPGLVPLTLAPDLLARTQPISGVSLPVAATAGRNSFREAMLFTHRGLSGPAILQISSVWREGGVVEIDLLPDLPADFLIARKRARPKAGVRTLLHEVMPQRAADLFAPEGTAADTQDKTLLALGASLKAWTVTPAGTEGYAKAEVTLGGIDTNALSSRTMESTKVPGLFAIGEAVDVTGWLGGYNFQWAWASGYSAGLAA